MTILFANQKGGVGKSTLCLALANYISKVKGNKSIYIFDADFQKSLHTMYDNDIKKVPNADEYGHPNMVVFGTDLKESDYDGEKKIGDYFQFTANKLLSMAQKFHERDENAMVLIDLPGQLQKPHLKLYKHADLIITPFAYDTHTFNSTLTFLSIVERTQSKAQVLLVPNRQKSGANYIVEQETDDAENAIEQMSKEKVNEALKKYGYVTSELKDRVAFQRINTLKTPDEVNEQVNTLFDDVYNKFIQKVPN
jgi:chromosome partitioning protein